MYMLYVHHPLQDDGDDGAILDSQIQDRPVHLKALAEITQQIFRNK